MIVCYIIRSCRPLINKPPTLHRDYNTDPNIQALVRRGFINLISHGSTLVCAGVWGGEGDALGLGVIRFPKGPRTQILGFRAQTP